MISRPFLVLAVATAIFAAVPLVTSDHYAISILTSVFLWAYLASSWNILGGMTGLLSFGHAVFLGLGAYCSATLFINLGWHPLIGGAIGILAACIASIAIAYVSAHYNLVHLHFALVTTAIGQIAFFIALDTQTIGGPAGISLPYKATPAELFFRDPAVYYWIFLVMAALVLALTLFLRGRRTGLYFLCVRESEMAAQGAGIDIVRQKLLATVISAALTAFGGVIYAHYLRFLDPDSIFGWQVSLQMVIPAMLGGATATFGPAIGAFIFVTLQELTRSVVDFAGAPMIIVGLVLIPVVLFLPAGVVPSLEKLLGRRHRTIKPKTHDTAVPATAEHKASAAEPAATPLRPRLATEILRVEGLSKRFGGVQAVNNVSLTCRDGERLAIIGPNGAGKSTLFALLGGFVKPDRGSIWFAGGRIDGLAANEVCRRGLARTFQTAQPFRELTVMDNVLASTFLRANGHGDALKAAHDVLALFQLSAFATVKASDLNVVDQKRLELARAWATRPELILLDEVGAGLTGPELDQLTDLLASLNAAKGTTIIFIEHVMSMVSKLAERVIVLHHGEILAEGTLAEVSANPVVIDAYLGESTLAA
jgi:branched-chain amino acid transport system permease protein